MKTTRVKGGSGREFEFELLVGAADSREDVARKLARAEGWVRQWKKRLSTAIGTLTRLNHLPSNHKIRCLIMKWRGKIVNAKTKAREWRRRVKYYQERLATWR